MATGILCPQAGPGLREGSRIMLNKVHMETLRAHTPYRDWFTMDAAVRFLEAKHGWTHTLGPMRWDAAALAMHCWFGRVSQVFDASGSHAQFTGCML